MKLESAYFDKIRTRAAQPAPAAKARACQFKGCAAAGDFRAPKGRKAEGEYYWFCLDHVRNYNKGYNYFSGMDDASIQTFQKDSVVGHRPTWRMGIDAKAGEAQPIGGRAKFGWSGRPRDPFEVFPGAFERRPPPPAPRRKLHNMERASLRTLDLDETAKPAEVKARYKLLVKRHHPDANGGDRSLEDRLREIIQAYNYLKSVGFC